MQKYQNVTIFSVSKNSGLSVDVRSYFNEMLPGHTHYIFNEYDVRTMRTINTYEKGECYLLFIGYTVNLYESFRNFFKSIAPGMPVIVATDDMNDRIEVKMADAKNYTCSASNESIFKTIDSLIAKTT